MKLSAEQIERANTVNLPQFLMQNGIDLKRVGREYVWKEHGSLHIKDNAPSERGVWHRFSTDEGGDNIAFLQTYMNMSFVEAVETLNGEHYDRSYTPPQYHTPKQQKAQAKELVLSENSDSKRVFAYLCKTRGLDYNLVRELVQGGTVSQEQKTGNVLFKYYDDKGKVIGAEKVGTSTEHKFNGIATGSASGHGFEVCRGNGSDLLFFESSIDMLSYLQMHSSELTNHRLVSMMGVKPQTVIDTMERYGISPDHVFLCSDNDKAGNEFAERLMQEYPDMKRVVTPDTYKDWNDMLRGIPKKEINVEQQIEKKEADKMPELYGNKYWNKATDNRNKSIVSVSAHDFPQVQEQLENAGINYYAYPRGESVIMAINDADVEKFGRLTGAPNIVPQKSQVTYVPPEKNIIGNTEYRYIPQKEYISADRDLILKMADKMEKQGIRFSGRIYPTGKGTLTVSQNDLYRVRSIRDEVIAQRRQIGAAEKGQTIGNRSVAVNNRQLYLSTLTPQQFEEIKPFIETNAHYNGVIRDGKVMFAVDRNEAQTFHRALETAKREVGLIHTMQDKGLPMEQMVALSPLMHRLAVEDAQLQLSDFFDKRYDEAQFGEMLSLVNSYLDQPTAERFGEHSKLNNMLEAKSSFDRSIELADFFSQHDFSAEQRAAVTAMFVGDVTRGQIDCIDETFTPADIQAYDEILHNALQESDITDFLTAHAKDVTLAEAYSSHKDMLLSGSDDELANFRLHYDPEINGGEGGYNLIADRTAEPLIRDMSISVLSDDISFDTFKNFLASHDLSFDRAVDTIVLEKQPTEEEVLFGQANLAMFLASGTLSSDEWEDMAYPLFEDGYLDKHKPNDKAAYGYHLSEPEFYDLAQRYHDGEDIRKELALALMEHKQSDDIEFVFEEGEISNRTFYYAENLRHTLHAEYGEDSVKLSFGGMEREISYAEIGQAFLDKIQDEYADIVHFRTMDELAEVLPTFTEDVHSKLIDAFDGAAMHGWEQGDNQAKINRIKKALHDILGDEEQTEKAFAAIAKEKYNVSFEPEQKERSIHFGLFGNGVTAYDVSRTDPETHDYPTVAHISTEGVVTIYDDTISAEDRERINEQAQSEREEFMHDWKLLTPEQQYKQLLDRADTAALMNINHDALPMEQKIDKYMPYVFFGEGERPEPEHEQAHGTFEIYQMKSGEQYHFNRFESLERNKDADLTMADYDLVYSGDLSDYPAEGTFDAIYTKFNVDHPEDFRGHSLSMSDVIVTEVDGVKTAHYCDDIGFTEFPDFFKEKELVQEQAQEQTASHKTTVADLSAGDIIMFDGSHREVEEINSERIKLRDLDAPDYGGILLSTSDVYSFDGWQEQMNEKGFEILSKAEPKEEGKDFGSVTMRKVGDFYEMYGKNAEIAAEVLDLHLTTKNGEPMVGFPEHVKAEYADKLRDAGYTVLEEQAFEIKPPKRDERLITLESVVEKFFGTDCEVAQTINGVLKLAATDGDKLAEFFYKDKPICGIYDLGDHIEIKPYQEFNNYPKQIANEMLKLNPNKPVEIAEFQRTFDTPLDKAKHLINEFCEGEYESEADFSDLSNVDIAFTTLTDDELPIQVTADLEKFKIIYEFDGEVFKTEQYDSIEDMVDNGLTGLDFNDLVYVPDEVIERHTAKDEKSETIDLMSDADTVHDAPAQETVSPVTIDFKGDSESLAEMKDYALSLGATVTTNDDTISVATYTDHMDELLNKAYELALSSTVRDNSFAEEVTRSVDGQTVDETEQIADDDAPLFADEDIIQQIQEDEKADVPFWETPDIQGEQLTLFGDPEPVVSKQQKAEKPKPEFAAGPIVDGVQVYEALAVEIDRGTGFVDGKIHVQEFYDEQHPTTQQLADFLKTAYGIGGHSGEGNISLVSTDGKGLTFDFENGEKFRHSWFNVATMTAARLEDNTYLSAEQQEKYAQHRAEKTAEAETTLNPVDSRSEENDNAVNVGDKFRNKMTGDVSEVISLEGAIPWQTDDVTVTTDKGSYATTENISVDKLLDTRYYERVTDTEVEKTAPEKPEPVKAETEQSSDLPKPKNLSQLKKAIQPGMMFEITAHSRPDCVGERRVVTGVNTVEFTSKKLDENGEPYGKDIFMEFDRAKNWSFDNGEMTSHLEDGSVLMSFHFIDSKALEKSAPEVDKADEQLDRAFLSQVIGKLNDHYDEMYQAHDNVDGFAEAVAVGDKFIKDNPDFMGKLADLRHDIISSDRETAALAFALVDVGLLEKFVTEPEKAELAPEKSEPELSVGDFIEYKGKDYKIENIENGGFITLCEAGQEDMPRIMSRVTFLTDEFLANAEYKVIEPAAVEAPEKGDNFTITDDSLGEGGAKAKFRANVDAIKTLKTLEKEHRPATDEEKEILSKYVGWGGVAQAFDKSAGGWSAEYAELKELLTPQEYRQAQASTLDAFYTSPTIIDGIYEALGNFGFDGGNVLEPAMGVGNFFGKMPSEMRENSQLYGVEIDSISGRIAQALYPDADIAIQGFEKNAFQNGCFDVAVGNVPFGDLGFTDTKHNTSKLHDFFFAEALDKIKDGGIIAFVTSSGTLDKKDESVRQMLADKADFIGAVRLPGGKNGAFKDNAGTEVTTDIIFLKKHEGKSLSEMMDVPDWVHIGTTADGLPINQYFANNPDMVLGEVIKNTNPRGGETMVVAEDGFDLRSALHDAVSKLSAEISKEPAREVYAKNEQGLAVKIPSDLRNFSFFMQDDQIFFKKNDVSFEQRFDKTNAQFARYKAFIELRDITRELIEAQELNKSDSVIKELQGKLNTAYDAFYKKYGLIHSKTNKRYFNEDVSYNLVAGLEKKIDKDKLVEKSDIFTKRTICPPKAVESVETAMEALTLSIAEKAKVDFDYMSQLTGMTEDELKHDLVGEIFKVPHTENEYQTASEYLSGDIRAKLRDAEEVAEYDSDFNINVNALQKAMPEPLKAGDIDVKIGATWLDPKYYDQFMYELLGTPDGNRADKPQSRWYKPTLIQTEYSASANSWHISNKKSDRSVLVNQKYGTPKMNAYEIFEHLLNLKEPKVYKAIEVDDGLGGTKEKRVVDIDATRVVQKKAKEMKKAFKAWIFKDAERREAIVDKYNELFNSVRPREFDGSHLTFPMMNADIHLHEHQKNAIAHAMFGGNTLFAHSVGAGKTFEMIATAMESKRLGLCTKSLFAVPNHLTEQIGDDFQRLYPGANILVATKKDFQKANRQQLFAKIATGNYDAVIIGHSQLGMIPVSRERQEMTIQSQIDDILKGIEELKKQDGSKFQIKALERTRKSLQKQLDKLQKVNQDDTLTFEQLGIDKLFVDEAHEFKNLFTPTKLQNVAGISNSASQKALDLFLKCRYLDEKTGGKGVTFATGTPLSNSITELHTMMRYLEYDFLSERGLQHFDNWISTFGEQKSDWELAPAGNKFKERTRIANYSGLPELMSMFKQVADIRTADTLHLDVPDCDYKVVQVEATPFQQELVQELSDRADAINSGNVDPSIDNMLKITSDGRKLGLDPRLIDPSFEDNPDTKLNRCVENVARIHAETAEDKLTQIIFCDLGVPHGAGKEVKLDEDGDVIVDESKSAAEQDSLEEECDFCVYTDIKEKLIVRGIPAEEIAFIHDAKTEQQKVELFEKVRSGEIRVLLGSTGKMGTGTNVQDKLIAVHDLDIPWRPADLEQRAGRIIRQGNQNKNVEIYRYVTKGTFDAYSYQTLENKQKFISQIMTSKTPARKCQDIDQQALTYSEIKALCTGDERIKEKLMLDNDVKELRTLAAEYANTVYEMEDKIKAFPMKEEQLTATLEHLQADRKTLKALPIDPETKLPVFKITIGDTEYTDRKEAAKALEDAALAIRVADTPVKVGSFQGFDLSITVHSPAMGGGMSAQMKGQHTHTAKLISSFAHNLSRIEAGLYNIDRRIDSVKNSLSKLRVDYEEAQKIVATPFPQQEELDSKSERLETLTQALNLAAIEAKKNAPKREQTCYFQRAQLKREAARVAKKKSAPKKTMAQDKKKDGLE